MSKLRLIVLVYLMSINHGTFAYDYDPLLMRAQASIFPKIILLDKNLSSKVDQDKVVISILYGKGEKDIAHTIESLIIKQYKHSLGQRSMDIRLIAFEDFEEFNASTAYFLLKGARELRDRVTRYAARNQRLVFCYDYKDFESNALVSVLMKEKTYIYLNKSAIHDYDIKFLPLFYKIVKVIE